MATLNLADGESFVKGRSAEKAGELLGFAGKERTAEVRTTTGGYIVPSDILPEGYEAITNADLPAVRTEPGTSTNVDEVYNKGGEAKRFEPNYIVGYAASASHVSRETEDAEAQALADEQAREEAPAFDPAEHTISEVEAYLEEAEDDERARVFAAEEAGKQRKGVLDLAKTAEEAK